MYFSFKIMLLFFTDVKPQSKPGGSWVKRATRSRRLTLGW
jgi:hypothetical protein